MSASTTKKPNTPPATASPSEQITILRNHILSCPEIPSNSPILRSLIATLDKESQKIIRDEKLRQKFSQSSSTATSTQTPTKTFPQQVNATTTNIPSHTQPPSDEIEDDMEWQNVPQPQQDSPLGKSLAEIAISSLSRHSITVSTPLAALTAAIHSALLHLGFKCIGIPPPSTGGGFAPPIREIKSFLPPKWELGCLRYRKPGVGVVVLTLTSLEDNCRITFGSSESHLEFPMERHVNRNSLASALASQKSGVAPALHYKSLAGLMTDFARLFDLGSVKEEEKAVPQRERVVCEPNREALRCDYEPYRSPQISDFMVGRPHPGDFVGDILPGGGFVDPIHSGNLMGPNHPAFLGGRDETGMMGGGLGMRPRFDPYGPPGGPMDIGRGRGRGRGRGGHDRRGFSAGNPNPDHLRPPSMGDDMFM